LDVELLVEAALLDGSPWLRRYCSTTFSAGYWAVTEPLLASRKVNTSNCATGSNLYTGLRKGAEPEPDFAVVVSVCVSDVLDVLLAELSALVRDAGDREYPVLEMAVTSMASPLPSPVHWLVDGCHHRLDRYINLATSGGRRVTRCGLRYT
jgi:hypothetical protein